MYRMKFSLNLCFFFYLTMGIQGTELMLSGHQQEVVPSLRAHGSYQLLLQHLQSVYAIDLATFSLADWQRTPDQVLSYVIVLKELGYYLQLAEYLTLNQESDIPPPLLVFLVEALSQTHRYPEALEIARNLLNNSSIEELSLANSAIFGEDLSIVLQSPEFYRAYLYRLLGDLHWSFTKVRQAYLFYTAASTLYPSYQRTLESTIVQVVDSYHAS